MKDVFFYICLRKKQESIVRQINYVRRYATQVD